MIVVVAFGRGPDAVVMDLLQVLSSQYGVPYLNLVLDKDTEEAGFVTRVEAVADMLERKVCGQDSSLVAEEGFLRL